MTQLYLIRHGQTDWNVEGRYQGQTDMPLNAVGRVQAEALAHQLAGTQFKGVYSSEVIAASLGLIVQLDRRLREINQGAWEGQLVSDIAANYQAAWGDRTQDPLNARAPGGESVAEVAARLAEAAEAIARAHPVGPVLVVSHGLALATLICQARRRPLAEAYQAIPQNGQPEAIEWPPLNQN